MPGTRKLGRTTDHRMSMLRGQVTLLLDNGSIRTTVTRAKEIRSLTDKMITLGKTNTLASKRQALAFITKEDVVKKLFDNIAPSLSDRNGGYTRIYRLGPRRGDGAEMALIELVNLVKEDKKSGKDAKAAAKKPAAKKADTSDKKEETKAEATEAKPAAKKSTAKKTDSADAKPAAKKPAAKKPAAKKAEEEKSDDK